MNRKGALGATGEVAAARYLEGRRHAIIARNVRSRFGEIDLVTLDRGTIVFVEVRSRSGATFGSGAESVVRAKRLKLTRAAEHFLARRHLEDRPVRFDVVGIDWQGGEPTIEHIEDAFSGEY